MYHDTIHINFIYNNWKDINFNYSFLISKNSHQAILGNMYNSTFSFAKYGKLLQNFEEIGFNTKYLKFNDIDENAIVYCSYNYQPNFNIFFSAYKKLIQNKDFDINFEYGNIINGKFIPNNMNFFSGIYFWSEKKPRTHILNIDNPYLENVVEGKKHLKVEERYQLIDQEGTVIHKESTTSEYDFEQHFFEKYEVKVALRKYKLGRLGNLFK